MIKFLVPAFILVATSVVAQNSWNGHKSAVVLTYDDALNVHLDKVIPQLDSAGFKGTFYLTVASQAFNKRMPEWKIAATKGHELANHTMYHPCAGGTGREWVRPEYDLRTYSVTRIEDELKMTNVLLQTVDGKTERTFAYPCGDIQAGGLSYIEAISDDFVAARSVRNEIVHLGKFDPYTVACFSIAGQNSDYMIDIAKRAMKEGGLAVFLFHGVGGEHNLNVDAREHQKLVAFLKKYEKDIWVASFIDVMKFAKTSK
jgi:peptidoglycan-N-acetylglucosamine deacetylase